MNVTLLVEHLAQSEPFTLQLLLLLTFETINPQLHGQPHYAFSSVSFNALFLVALELMKTNAALLCFSFCDLSLRHNHRIEQLRAPDYKKLFRYVGLDAIYEIPEVQLFVEEKQFIFIM